MKAETSMMIVRFGNHFNVRLGEWLASFILVSLGVLFFGAPSLMQQSPIYFGNMLQAGSQVLWGCGFIFIGVVRIVALYINGRKRITPYIRMGLAFLACFVWWQVAMSLFLSGIPGLGWAVFPWLLALDMYNVFRSSADARDVFDAKRAERDNGRNEAN